MATAKRSKKASRLSFAAGKAVPVLTPAELARVSGLALVVARMQIVEWKIAPTGASGPIPPCVSVLCVNIRMLWRQVVAAFCCTQTMTTALAQMIDYEAEQIQA